MKRRKALKGMVLFALGTQVVYSCKDKFEAIKTMSLPELPLTDSDLNTLDVLAQRILPLGEVEALKDHTTLPFILTMAHDCLSPDHRNKFTQGYQALGARTEEIAGKKMDKMNEEEFRNFLNTLNASENPDSEDPVSFTVRYVRDKNIQYILNSKYFLTTYREYEMAPGIYKGCEALT